MDEAEFQAKMAAQEKTIQVLMDTVERQSAEGASSLELLSQNLSLEQVVQRKTEALQKALRDLQQTQTQLLQASKLESVGLLAAGIAHEINTPAQFIGSNIDFLDESFVDVQRLMAAVAELAQVVDNGGDVRQIRAKLSVIMEKIDWPYLKEEIPAAIRQSKEGVRRISAIVQAMKEFSHPSSKEMVKTNLNHLLETTVIVASNEWKYVAEMETDLDPDLPPTACLAAELGQVFLNILVNAAHAVAGKIGASGEKKGRIRIVARQYGDQVEIRISDSGTGIPEEIRGRVFDPFFTTKAVGKGTGQGLAIAHDVVTQKHGGTLTFESQTGEGTTFIIRLPIEQGEAA
jgi:two-component system, NtrC family, sensor kinase